MSRLLSLEMSLCLEFAKKHNGQLHRFPGGYWAHANWDATGGRHFGTKTVEALVSRGLLVYSAWQESRSGPKFPILATVNQEK